MQSDTDCDLSEWVDASQVYAREGVPARLKGCSLADVFALVRTQYGISLSSLSDDLPVLLVCLRHFGCTFCRETLADLADCRRALELQGVSLALVHFEETNEGRAVLERYGLMDVSRIRDTEQVLYRFLGLGNMSLKEFVKPRSLWRFFSSSIFHRHGVGRSRADRYRMPGVFLVHRGQIIKTFRHHSPADRPDYVALAEYDLPRIDLA